VRLDALDGVQTDRYLVLGQVIGVHLNEAYLRDGIMDITLMKPLARCGYQDYAVVDKVFSLKRPAGAGNQAAGG
jgi:flavin reductase (DIM6/NTAB) family NADH-FMN oxidoreductase RutF